MTDSDPAIHSTTPTAAATAPAADTTTSTTTTTITTTSATTTSTTTATAATAAPSTTIINETTNGVGNSHAIDWQQMTQLVSSTASELHREISCFRDRLQIISCRTSLLQAVDEDWKNDGFEFDQHRHNSHIEPRTPRGTSLLATSSSRVADEIGSSSLPLHKTMSVFASIRVPDQSHPNNTSDTQPTYANRDSIDSFDSCEHISSPLSPLPSPALSIMSSHPDDTCIIEGFMITTLEESSPSVVSKLTQPPIVYPVSPSKIKPSKSGFASFFRRNSAASEKQSNKTVDVAPISFDTINTSAFSPTPGNASKDSVKVSILWEKKSNQSSSLRHLSMLAPFTFPCHNGIISEKGTLPVNVDNYDSTTGKIDGKSGDVFVIYAKEMGVYGVCVYRWLRLHNIHNGDSSNNNIDERDGGRMCCYCVITRYPSIRIVATVLSVLLELSSPVVTLDSNHSDSHSSLGLKVSEEFETILTNIFKYGMIPRSNGEFVDLSPFLQLANFSQDLVLYRDRFATLFCNESNTTDRRINQHLQRHISNVSLLNNVNWDAGNPMGEEACMLLSEWSWPLLFNRFDLRTILVLFSCVLTETRVVVVSSSLASASAIVLALASLVRPFSWEGVICPVLPDGLFHVLESPVPFIVGLQNLPRQFRPDPRHLTAIVYPDTRKVEYPFGTPPDIPYEKRLLFHLHPLLLQLIKAQDSNSILLNSTTTHLRYNIRGIEVNSDYNVCRSVSSGGSRDTSEINHRRSASLTDQLPSNVSVHSITPHTFLLPKPDLKLNLSSCDKLVNEDSSSLTFNNLVNNSQDHDVTSVNRCWCYIRNPTQSLIIYTITCVSRRFLYYLIKATRCQDIFSSLCQHPYICTKVIKDYINYADDIYLCGANKLFYISLIETQLFNSYCDMIGRHYLQNISKHRVCRVLTVMSLTANDSHGKGTTTNMNAISSDSTIIREKNDDSDDTDHGIIGIEVTKRLIDDSVITSRSMTAS